MSTVTSCTVLCGRPAATPVSSSGGRLQSGKASAVAPCFQRKPRPLSLCFASLKGDHGPKADLPPFNISPVALIELVSPLEERWQLEEKADAVSLWFQVPGLSKEDIAVEIDEDVLVIRKKAIVDQSDNPTAAAANSYRTGRDTAVTGGGSVGSYKGSRVDTPPAKGKVDVAYDSGVYARLLFPAGYNRESVLAELDSGVLTVTIGKVKEHARRKINVHIDVK